jgi:hypothetical protein
MFVLGPLIQENNSPPRRNPFFFFYSEVPGRNVQGTCSDTLYRCAGEVAYKARRTVTCNKAPRLFFLNEGRYTMKFRKEC